MSDDDIVKLAEAIKTVRGRELNLESRIKWWESLRANKVLSLTMHTEQHRKPDGGFSGWGLALEDPEAVLDAARDISIQKAKKELADARARLSMLRVQFTLRGHNL